jgi:hypothetical protein
VWNKRIANIRIIGREDKRATRKGSARVLSGPLIDAVLKGECEEPSELVALDRLLEVVGQRALDGLPVPAGQSGERRVEQGG